MYKFDSEAFIKEMEEIYRRIWKANWKRFKKWFIRGIIKCLKLEQLI